jgi:tetratricopeptide (TPR) repeat protein
MPVEPVHRGILAADIEGFSRPERSNPLRVRMRDALYGLISRSLRESGIESGRAEETDHGDCVLILFDASIPKARLFDPFLHRLNAALARRNRDLPRNERLRLRIVIHAGELLRDAHGHSGEDLNTAFRLLDSDILRANLAAASGDLAVIVSDSIYQAIVKHGYGRIEPAAYRPVSVIAKETTAIGWIYLPESPRRAVASALHRAGSNQPARGRVGISHATQLPADAVGFTGRRRELRRLRQLLGAAGRGSGVPVVAIHGIGGVGKSALAVRAAHSLAARFPDGQLYVDLRGSTATPESMQPLEAMGRFLRALGLADEDVPQSLEDATDHFRTLLSGRRVLVVLDNAADAAQVEPLLPTTIGCAALVTSRQGLLAFHEAVPQELNVLSPEESVRLLRRLAGAERVGADPTAAMAIAAHCGHLPLALRIAGARLAARGSWPLRALAEQLADTRHRLDRLQVGDLVVRASFQLSYQALLDSEGGILAARTFRLLGLLDGPDVGIPVAAALVDRPPVEVETVLEQLTDAHMLESPVPGRYRLHDLLRLYAREQANEQERPSARRAALRRALRCYLATTRRANRLMQPPDLGRGIGSEAGSVQFDDPRDARAWLDAERVNLLSAARQVSAEADALAVMTVDLAEALFWYLQASGFWADWLAVNELAVEVTRRLGDRQGESQSLSDLAGAHHRLGRVSEAIVGLESALEIHRESGDRIKEALVLSNLGIVYRDASRFEEAISCCERSREISRDQSDPYGEAVTLNTLGKIYHELERFDEAISAYGQSLGIFEDSSNRYGQGNVLANLGEVCRVAGRTAEAVECCERSLRLFREVGDRSDEAEALLRLGRALAALGERERAREAWRESLAIFEAMSASRAKQVEDLLREDSSDSL